MNRLSTVLQQVSVLCRDNGYVFTNTERLDAISSLLRGSTYQRIEADGLFHMYSRKPVSEIHGPVMVVSSHVDCEYHITKCFAKFQQDDMLLGTFDNSITNAAIVYLMLAGRLPDCVLIAFTGDEEQSGRGTKDVIRFIRNNKLKVLNVFVLDVTEEGWSSRADFTIENDFWDDDFGKKIIDLAERTGFPWKYVPGEPDSIPYYIPKERIVNVEAYEDESWEYDEADIPCFSFCLPTKGEMHSDDGILARVQSLNRYTEVLERMLNTLNDMLMQPLDATSVFHGVCINEVETPALPSMKLIKTKQGYGWIIGGDCSRIWTGKTFEELEEHNWIGIRKCKEKDMAELSKETQWLLLLTKLDGLNRRIKEPGWSYQDKQEVYSLKDRLMGYILKNQPQELTVKWSLVPYYAYSQESKDKAGHLMRSDTDSKPFEYYLGQIQPGPNDIEIPEKATVEALITCAGQEYSFHQPLSWYIEHGGITSGLEKKVWIGANSFHHMYLVKVQKEINDLQRELNIIFD